MARHVQGSLPAVVTILALCCSSAVAGLYFPMDAVRVVIPKRLATNGLRLLSVAALRDDGSALMAVTYHLDAAPGRFSLDPVSGELRLAAPPTGRGEQHWSAVIEAQESAGGPSARMRISVVLKDVAISNESASTLCFWQHVQYSVFENRPATVLGSLGPDFYSSDTSVLNYTLINGTQYASVGRAARGDVWELSSRKDLDRDSLQPGPQLFLRVGCTAKGRGYAETTLLVVVKDEDDNPPALQEPGLVDVYLRDNRLVEGEELNVNVVLVDNDTVEANIFQARLENDIGGLLELLPPSKMEDDTRVVPRTALHFKLRAAANTTLTTPYNFRIKVTDTSMPPRFQGTNHAEVYLQLRREEAAPEPTAAAWRTGGTAAAPSYPPRVWLFRGAGKYSRVATPRNYGDATFTLSAGNDTFAVTRRAGILYVDSPEALQQAPPTVTVRVVAEQPDHTITVSEVEVHLLDDAAGPCEVPRGNVSSGNIHCSEKKGLRGCKRLCGLASVRGQLSPDSYHTGCQWRDGNKVKSETGGHYSTCSVDVTTCPDRRCDPLEELYIGICPQDCSRSKFFDTARHLSGRTGYMRGDIVCSCDLYANCVCLAQDDAAAGQQRRSKSTTAPGTTAAEDDDPDATTLDSSTEALQQPGAARIHQTDSEGRSPECGVDCVVGVAAASLLVVLAAVASCILWRYRCVNQSRRARKYAGALTSVTGQRSEYLGRSQQPVDGNLPPFDPALPLSPDDPRATPDPKWEFPRARLIIEQTLGEGEFGRVMRARALDIASYPGYTTVAVKTLKEDASSTELADLLSEYQLLKDVSHPNVIRLLGACTEPGAPVYLIIEFAEHGSLRNYLRRSRHVESEGKMPNSFGSSDTSTPPKHMKITTTPRDILSFAWQICKGMAYLSEIKLVHRDLAARNVLVGAGRICKISDFGLTRDIYEDDAYLKRSKGRVPVKWMAVESLADHVYTSKSDVWSFGVLLWELVTLGASPYPGVAVHNLFHLLRAGYRMERPENCSTQLYRVMRSCWQAEAGSRPSFKELTLVFERMLEDGVEYLDLNPRVVHNRTYFTSLTGHRDNLPLGEGGVDEYEEEEEDEDEVRYGNLSLLRSESTTPLVAPEVSTHEPLGSVAEEPADNARLLGDSAATTNTTAATAYLSPVRRPPPAYVTMTGNPASPSRARQTPPTSQTHV